MRFLPLALVGSLIFTALGAPPGEAQTTAPTADGRGAVAVAPQNATRPLRGGGANQIAANGAPIVLEVNKGTLIRLSAPAATVFIANPDIADVQVKSPSLIYISAKAPGETVIYAVDASDSVLLNSPVRVERSSTPSTSAATVPELADTPCRDSVSRFSRFRSVRISAAP